MNAYWDGRLARHSGDPRKCVNPRSPAWEAEWLRGYDEAAPPAPAKSTSNATPNRKAAIKMGWLIGSGIQGSIVGVLLPFLFPKTADRWAGKFSDKLDAMLYPNMDEDQKKVETRE